MGLYYLQSRYYNPEMSRFLNGDRYASTGQDVLGTNMFAYCNNNPVNAVDPYGEDAIWLQELDNPVAGIAGHTGLLIQDDTGKWYYFNCNDQGCSLVPQEGFTYSGMNSFPYSIKNKYDRFIYFEGDFSASVTYAKWLTVNFSSKDHDFWENNCMQVSTDVLRRGRFTQSDACYKSFLRRVRNSIVPNIAYSRMVNFHKAVRIYHAAPKWIKWLYTSPEMAVWIY